MARILTHILLSLWMGATGVAHAYEGRDSDASWRKDALTRIEAIRKASLSVTIVDQSGKQISGAAVSLRMKRHAFGFGSAVWVRDLMAQSEDGRRYRSIVERSFNKVVLENDLKWKEWETSATAAPGASFDRKNTYAALAWLKDRRIRVRGHFVAWGHLEGDVFTEEYSRQNNEAFRLAVMRHAEQKVHDIGDSVSEWDVVNHPLGWHRGTMLDRFGGDFYDVLFARVAQWNPRAARYINEGGVLPKGGYNRSKYYDLLKEMLGRHAPIQGIGFMGHFFAEQNLPPPVELLGTLDRYAALGLPLQITEFDVRFGRQGEFMQLSAAQEALQADYTRDFLIAAFSHPRVVGVVIWGFWEGRHWYPSAALYRKDWSLKPNGKVWDDLVLKQWWTHERGITGSDGIFQTRGFLGEYDLTASYAGRTVSESISLQQGGTRRRMVIPLTVN